MWYKKSVAIVLPTYREKRSIARTIREFDASGYVDEIIVVDNNAESGTENEVKKTRARLIKESQQGYGYAIQTGINNTKADLIIIAEPDGSFNGKDIVKLLAYSDDFDMVFGSRTHVPLIHKGSDMNFVKRIGDVILGKLVTVLFLCSPLTDLGCSFRLTSRKAWERIALECLAGDGIFATEWVLVAAKNKIKFMEIPVNYRARVGKSTTGDTLAEKIVRWGGRKFFYIWKVWFYKITRQRLYQRDGLVERFFPGVKGKS